MRYWGLLGRGGWGLWAGGPWVGPGGKVGEGYLMSFCPADSPGTQAQEASGQGTHWPQQVDHSPELGAPSHAVSDMTTGVNWEQGFKAVPYLVAGAEES